MTSFYLGRFTSLVWLNLNLRDIGVRMQSKHLRGVHKGESVNMIHVLRYRGTLWYGITLVEIKTLLEH